jgi:cellulose synthase (UDP-forming)
VYVFIFLLLTSIVGVAKALYTDEFSISLVWNALNTFVFGYFVFMARAEGRLMKRQRKQEKKHLKSLKKLNLKKGATL